MHKEKGKQGKTIRNTKNTEYCFTEYRFFWLFRAIKGQMGPSESTFVCVSGHSSQHHSHTVGKSERLLT